MRRLAPILFLLCSSVAAQAQVRSVEVRTPRPFGYFLGDLVRAQVDIVVEPGFALQSASLPHPGAMAYWLDLRDIAVSDASVGDGRRVRLDLTYQNFYAALDARALEIPGFTVTFVSESDRGATTAKAQVPAWSFNISPLREVQPPARAEPQSYMRPDGRVAALDPQPLVLGGAGFAAMALVAFAGLAWDRTWWPFAGRGGRAFALCLRRLRTLFERPDPDAAYGEGLLALHRALDETDGRRVLADDLPTFLARHPAYRTEERGLAAFLDASRHTFFGSGPAAGTRLLAPSDLVSLTRRLAAIERAS
ncbi:nonribosomal peptide synthetase MxaA [Methylobacterium marchantiae]|uniref:Nonribosomal peptide synthetase MxaA n=1 Tax=Methylobacterium marchantiae TaxID=600331 RepID=A0ABW3WVV6_9HYPH|nr:hypothetical protein AIGOOFII_1533 [Methylobacterium marchantiae]